MAQLQQVRVAWSGGPGGPGISTFYGDDTDEPIQAYVASLFEGIALKVPSSITFTVPNSGNLIDVATGQPVGTWSSGTTRTIPATATGVYAAPVGGLIRWETADFHNGRRVVGKTFVVPLFGGAFDAAGTLTSTVVADLHTASSALVDGATGLRVYSHKFHAASSVVTSSVPDEAVVLRSRRD